MNQRFHRLSLFPYTSLFRSLLAAGDRCRATSAAAECGKQIFGVVVYDREPPHRRFAFHIRRRRKDRKSTRLNSSYVETSYTVFFLKNKNSMNASLQTPSHPP